MNFGNGVFKTWLTMIFPLQLTKFVKLASVKRLVNFIFVRISPNFFRNKVSPYSQQFLTYTCSVEILSETGDNEIFRFGT